MNINERSQLLFEYILSNGRNKNKSAGTSSSLSIKEFFESYWEKKILHIKPSSSIKFDGLLNMKEIESMIKKQPLQYGIDLNVTNVDKMNGKRITLDETSASEHELNLVQWNKIDKQLINNW